MLDCPLLDAYRSACVKRKSLFAENPSGNGLAVSFGLRRFIDGSHPESHRSAAQLRRLARPSPSVFRSSVRQREAVRYAPRESTPA